MNFIPPARIEYIVNLAYMINWGTFIFGSLVGISLLIYIHKGLSNKNIKLGVMNG